MAKTRAKGAPQDGAKANTIVYVHGIGNKPVESVLRCQWDHALFGFGLGERSRMAYWCQADRHGSPERAKCGDEDVTRAGSVNAMGLGPRALTRHGAGRSSPNELIDSLTTDPKRRAALKRLVAQMDVPAAPRAGTKRAEGLGDINFPDFLTRFVTGIFLEDVHDFFFDAQRRQRMKDSVIARLRAGNGPFVVVAHSQGSMIAYNVLHELGNEIEVPLFLTIGSPLGLSETRDQLREILRLPKGKLPVPRCVRSWFNVYDGKDPVAQREKLEPHYAGAIKPGDTRLDNAERDPHSATGYLNIPRVQRAVRDHVDLARFQRLAPFVLAADVTNDFERSAQGERRPLLIELTDPTWAASKIGAQPAKSRAKALPEDRAGMADQVVRLIESVTGMKGTHHDLAVQRLERYVSVRLTQEETQRLSSHEELARLGLALAPMYRVWRNAKKFALLDKSIHAIQVSPAHQAYQARGEGIRWAVLDSGCTPHPHFDTHDTIVARWDCTQVSDKPLKDDGVRRGAKKNAPSTVDRFGHGTHVAGIIAGAYDFGAGARGPARISGIAPLTKLHVYKVLDDDGEGDDAWIIKALDHIASINEKAGGPEIAGVNLSLGGEFEQEVFGCGHTPLCDELRRLWRQGVVVVLAAGNEGYRRIMSTDGDFGANVPCSIGDPANLEESIAVGAVHKEKPHTYGVSHFSSRGPTADGRGKPDCVAPGEQILSCRHDWRPARGKQRPTSSALYYKLDGTSMAAPHVSGLIACFLSVKREFIGQPDRVKKILLDNCTDLGRDRAMQGAGLPNLVKMLVET